MSSPRHVPTLTLAALASCKGLPEDHLREAGLSEGADGVEIPYLDEAGVELFRRRRWSADARAHTMQPKGVTPTLYGLWKLPHRRAEETLYLVEGESDCWTLWLYHLHTLGAPGAGCTAYLRAEHIQGWQRIVVVDECDAGSVQFVGGMTARLRELDYAGDARVIRMSAGAKDASALYLADREKFVQRWLALTEDSPRLELGEKKERGIPAEPRDDEKDAEPVFPLPAEEVWPEPAGAEAFFGVAGELVRLIDSETEADRHAVLVQFLTAFGNCVGRSAYWRIEDTHHYTNLFTVLVGPTSAGRKGTSLKRALAPFHGETDWLSNCIRRGLSSGEGLIYAVRDPVFKRENVRQDGRVVRTERNEVDPGAEDKRLLLTESEFGAVLTKMRREGNTLSTYLRDAWDGEQLASLVKNSDLKSTSAHISIIAHCTREELRKLHTETDNRSGFANRFCWFAVRRSKSLPEGGQPLYLAELAPIFSDFISRARATGLVQLDSSARQAWCKEHYERLSAPVPGIPPGLMDRAVAQVRRLALVYTLLDGAERTSVDHLNAALSLWSYSVRSVRWIFGESVNDTLADDLLAFLRVQGEKGASQTDIGAYLGRHQRGSTVGTALKLLKDSGLAYSKTVKTAGRPTTMWYCFCAKSAKSEISDGTTT